MHFYSNPFDQIAEKFIDWANAQNDIRAAIVVGSRTRQNPPPDEWSDLDITIYAHHPDQYLNDTVWLPLIGNAWIAFQNRTAGGEPEILTLFEGGYNVDFVFNRVEDLQHIVQAGIIPDGHWRGARVLVDKDNLAAKTIPSEFRPPARNLPSLEEFTRLVKVFWYTAHYTAKQIRRGDLWLVKIRDGNLKEATMQMLEWHARANHPSIDTWHMGRFYRDWADPRAVKAIDDIFGHINITDSWRALFATIDLFSWLASETGECLKYQYLEDTEIQITGLVKQLFNGDPHLQQRAGK